MLKTWPAHLFSFALLLKSIFQASAELADPVKVLMLETGEAAILLLLLCLLCRPLATILKRSYFISLRRPLGVWAFTLISTHLLTFVVLYSEFTLHILIEEIIEHPYVIAGFLAFVALLPLAITSTKKWQRKLKQNWVKLHKLVFLATFLGLIHIALQLREEWLSIFMYTLAFTLLVVWRFFYQRKKSSRTN